MIQEIVFATNNRNKSNEVQAMLGERFVILNLQDLGCDVDIPETGSSFAENAALKSSYVFQNYGKNCFADDSGLEVGALNYEPGIYSARYSGVRDDTKNMELLLKKLEGVADRSASFRTVISLVLDGQTYLFEGEIQGTIRSEPKGTQGFGYDPVFQPKGYDRTFAEMSLNEKNQISHRAIAIKRLIAFLTGQESAF